MAVQLQATPGRAPVVRPFTTSKPKTRWLTQAAGLLSLGSAQLVLPAPAGAVEAGKLFDFDATLPIMMLQILLLTFLLDKVLFGPVGRHLDARKALLDGKRADARRLAARAVEFKKDAQEILARVDKEIKEKVDAAVKEIKQEHEAQFEAAKQELKEERRRKMEELHAESPELKAQLEEQAERISEEILDKLLPKGLR